MNKMVKPAFCADTLVRQSQNRVDTNFINEAMKNKTSRFYFFSNNYPFLIAKNDKLFSVYFSFDEIPIAEYSEFMPIYAGEAEGAHIFLVNVKEENAQEIAQKLGGEFSNLRSTMRHVNIDNLEILGLGASIFGWHKNNQFCAKCGSKTVIKDMGFKRFCENCESEHFPRIDPVAIMLVLKDDKCLFGRSKEFPKSLYSVLAGFVEPCETIEQACRREVFEETNIEIGEVKIIGNQPWPFISQLMLGLEAEALNDNIIINHNELEDALWLTKSQARQLISKNGLEINGEVIFGPQPIAIAYSLIKYWLEK